MDKPELYNGYDELNLYLKEKKNLSYRGFLLLYQDVIVHSPPFLDNWNRMDDAWAKRYLKEAKGLYPSDFADIRNKVKFERDGNGLSAYWKEVINDRKKNSVKRKRNVTEDEEKENLGLPVKKCSQSITLICLVKGNTSMNAFAVDIGSSKLISHLKEAIKAKKQNDFAGVDADKLKLWKVEISDDNNNKLRNISLHDQDELVATKKISKYFPVTPAEEHIHVVVSLPESTSTNEEQHRTVYEFDIIVKPKRTKAFKWIVNVDQATIESLKESIHARFSVIIESTLSFSLWTFPKVCKLYGIGSNDPSLSDFPTFACECIKFNDEKSQAIINHLITDLKYRYKVIPISRNEASRSQYVCAYLVAIANIFEDKNEVLPEKNVAGPNGHGPVDFGLTLLQNSRLASITEVKDKDFLQGIAQNTVQCESSLSLNNKEVFGIITDAEKWYFLECSLNDDNKPKFKLSKPVVVVYGDEDMEERVKKVLGHIAWLLEKAQKLNELKVDRPNF